MHRAPPSACSKALRPGRVTAICLAGLMLLAAGVTPALAADPSPVSTSTPSTVPTNSPTPDPTATASSTTIGGDQLDLPGPQANLGPNARPFPDILAESWILADAATGEILASKNAHRPRPPASTLKTLTAFTLLPKLNLDAAYTVTPADAKAVGSRVGLIPGKTYTIRDLFFGLFLPSGNDAAEALARANSSVPETVDEMNGVADRIQAADTVVKNTSGLDAPGQVSSAYDLALIARAGLPLFLPFTTTKRYDFPGRKHRTYTIYNQNRLLTGGFRGTVGLKTGYTTNAGRTFVGAAERHGRTLIVTLMGIHESSAGAARKALLWGFHNQRKVTPVGVLVDPLTDAQWADRHGGVVAPVALQQVTSTTQTSPPVNTAGFNLALPALPGPWWSWLLIVLLVASVASLPLARRIRSKQPRRPEPQPARRNFADIS